MSSPQESPIHQRAHALIDEGNGLQASGRIDEAQARYQAARVLAPDLPRAHLNIGNVLALLRDEPGAIAAYEAALACNPDFAPANFNLGNLYMGRRQPEQAIVQYKRALQSRPAFADAAVALGNAHYQMGQWDAAGEAYRRALALQPGYAQVHRNLANTLLMQRRYAEGLPILREAMRLLPDDGASAATAFHASLVLCDWSQRAQDESLLVSMVDRGIEGILPLVIINIDLPGGSAASLQRRAGEHFSRHLVGRELALPRPAPRARAGDDRLRIGYLSADIREHPVMHLLKGVLERHDRAAHFVHLYSHGAVRDSMTELARSSVECFRDLANASDADAAAVIAADGIDILVDLQGYTEGLRLGIPALRPAPVHVNWLGYPGTMGHPSLADYLIGDPVVSPLDRAADFSETLALMPHCYLPTDRNRRVASKPGRSEAGLPEEGLVFCNFNQSFKYTPAMCDLWCRLLRAVPDSILWLQTPPDATRANLLREVTVRGVDPGRLIFAPRLQDNADHLARLALADIALDTFPYTSHTTACDALWSGVPLVTIEGNTFSSRVAASVLAAAGMHELVAPDGDACFSLALALAQDTSRRAGIRQRILATRFDVPLFDTPRFTRHLEALFARMWQQYLQGKRAAIVIEDSGLPGQSR